VYDKVSWSSSPPSGIGVLQKETLYADGHRIVKSFGKTPWHPIINEVVEFLFALSNSSSLVVLTYTTLIYILNSQGIVAILCCF
jgi:hypothetical protein